MSRPHVVASSEHSSLRDLELVTRATVEGLRQGLHRSPLHGFSAEFSQYRHYLPGDDLRYVDWKAFARTNKLYTRQFRETTNLSALFVVDISRSMDYPQAAAGRAALEAPRTKFALAQAVTGILGTLVLDQGDAAGVLAVDERAHLLPARSGHHHLRLFLSEIARLAPVGTTGIHDALRRAAAVLKRRGLVIVVSDLYDDKSELPELRRLARMGHDVIVIHTLAREELTLGVHGASELVDLETGRTVLLDPAVTRDDYAAALRRWVAHVEGQVVKEGMAYLRLVTGELLEPVLRRFLLSRRGGG